MSDHELLTRDEAGEFLRRSGRSIADLTAKRAIPHRKMRGTRRVLYPRHELILWLDGAALEVVESPGARIVRPVPTTRVAA